MEVLNNANKPIILAGKGAKGASDSLISFAEQLKAPIVLTLPGKGIVPDEHSHCLGGLGLLGTRPSTLAIEEADTLIMVGTSFPFTGFLPDEAKTIHIDKDPSQIGKRYLVDVGLAGDADQTLNKLTKLIKTPSDGVFLQNYQDKMKDW